jgi:cytosine/adenosine deaminase-related metal-dependent hydrolase
MEILSAGWVVPVSRPPLRDGRVAVQDGRIAWVGRPGDPGEPAGPVHDLGRGVLLPGLVNAHCHLELSHLAGALDAAAAEGYVAWVEALVEARGRYPPERVARAAEAAIDGLVRTGTAAVGDVSNTLAAVPLLTGSPLLAVVFFELLGWDPAAAPLALEAARRRIAEAGGRWPGPDVEVRIAAHAPHSVSPALLEALVADGGPAALHLAESPGETRFLAEGDPDWAAFLRRRGLGHVRFTPPGASPVRYVDGLGVLHPALVAAHCVQVDADDIARLARHRVGVVLCPRSNLRLGAGLPPVPALRAAGVRLALGSDSLASAPDLDVLEDARALRRAFPELGAELLVHLATAGGADVLGLPALGALEPGRRAALAYAAADRTPDEPHEFLLSDDARLSRAAA